MNASIKNLTRLSIGVYLASVLAGGIWLHVSAQRLSVISGVKDAAIEWNQGMLELMLLTSEAVPTSSGRSVDHWQRKYADLKTLIDGYGRLSGDPSRVESIRYTFGKLPPLALKIFFEPLSPRARNQYVVSMQSHMQFMILSSSRMAREANREADRIHHTDLVAIGLIFVAHLAVSALVLGLFGRWVNRPIDRLVKDVERLGRGDLATPIAVTGSREVRSISGALDRAREQLSQLTVSRDELERRVRARTADLEQANKDLEGFSYSVSHDLRAPLRAIDGFIAILTDEYGERLDDEGKRLFGIVSDNARRMGTLIDDILALSRAGRLALEIQAVDMNGLVDEVWNELVEPEMQRDIRFQREELPVAHCDPRAMRQVWQNLLSNALKFTRDRRPAVIEVSADHQGENICYRVRDNGAGFDPRYADKLFGLFQRLHGVDEFDGTGVGLTIVQRLLRKHGGDISGSGVSGAGASFEFTLPRQSESI